MRLITVSYFCHSIHGRFSYALATTSTPYRFDIVDNGDIEIEIRLGYYEKVKITYSSSRFTFPL
jgi:hypothetical protein